MAVGCTGYVGGGKAGTNEGEGLYPNGGSNAGGAVGLGGKTSDVGGQGATSGSLDDGEPSGSAVALACDRGAPPAQRTRLWRLTKSQYLRSIVHMIAGTRPGDVAPAIQITVTSPFDSVNPADRFSTFSSNYAMTDFEFRQVIEGSHALSRSVVAQYRAPRGGVPTTCLAPGSNRKPLATCMPTLVGSRGALLFRRPLSDDEVVEYTNLALDNVPALGEDEAVSLALQAMLMSPSFLFRIEVGKPVADMPGVTRLDGFEVAAAIALSLTDMPPDQALWDAATSGNLETDEEIRAQVMRTLAKPIAHEVMDRFVREYFHYDGVLDVFKDDPSHVPELLLSDTEFMVRDIVTSSDHDFLKTLLTTPAGYATGRTAVSYGVTGVTSKTPVTVTFATGQRSGILTQPSFLSTFSTNDANQPIQRGKFISESLLCRPVPQLPIDVVPVLPDLGPNATLRDRLAVHSAIPRCSACHALILDFAPSAARLERSESGVIA